MFLNSNGHKMVYKPEHPRAWTHGCIPEHILIAEKALGKPLPKGAVIHHHGKKTDNTRLVVCQDQAYHLLLHRRTKALRACGHANWRKCQFCKQYDKPENLYINKNHVYHKVCMAAYDKKRSV